jgi:hypothetical protein
MSIPVLHYILAFEHTVLCIRCAGPRVCAYTIQYRTSVAQDLPQVQLALLMFFKVKKEMPDLDPAYYFFCQKD